MANQNKLMKITYTDNKAEVYLDAYADTVVLEMAQDGNTYNLAAIRFGGYPERVRGISEAIYGGGSIEIEMGEKTWSVESAVKQYTRELSHDGVYAEATLMIKDEEQKTEFDETGPKRVTHHSARKCYLFCEQGDRSHLFEQLDKKTAVPLIPEFQKYVLDELEKRNILKQLNVISYKEKFDVWILELSQDEKNVIDVINDGLHSGAIIIPSTTSQSKEELCEQTPIAKNPFDEINSVTQYLNSFGVMIAERIKDQFQPLFDPATEALSPEILAVNANIKRNVGYSLYDAQLAIAEAHKRRLECSKSTLCIAECGSGKTKIGITVLHAYQQKNGPKKHFNAVLCPSHMTKKWVREIEESLPNTFAVVVNSIAEINIAYKAFEKDKKTCYIIMSKEKARDGYMRRPAAVWNKRQKAFICPDCQKKIMMELIDCGTKYRVEADQFFFQKENKKNHKCEYCDTPLWTVLVPNQQSEWIKVSEYGFVHRRLAHQHLPVVKSAAGKDTIEKIVKNPDERFSNAGAYHRFPLSTYIKRKMKGKLDGLVVDELHNYNNNSGQGDAMGELFGAAKKVVGMTATLINGYSSGIFYLLFRVAPNLMLLDDKSYDKSSEFNAEYGVTESVYEIKAADYNSNRRTSRKKVRERQLPGVSPLVYSRFLMDSAAFLSLNDMGKDLPEYEEIPVQLNMNKDVQTEYHHLEEQFKSILRTEKEFSRKILSSYLGLLTVYPDQPYDQKTIIHPLTGDDLVVPRDMSSFEELHEKDNSVLDVVKRKAAQGERVLIYTSWIRIDTQEKLLKLLTENGYRVNILTSSVPPNKREEWVEKQVKSGIQVLITNPSLVETGLDLNDFTTLYYYNIAYNLFTLRQSSRRSWRINQKAPRIEVYFTYYEDTMQHRAMRLMASKLAVAGIIEGNFSDEGLAAMSDCQDMTTALARELTMGIKNEVEDLSAVFKKMAILKPQREVIEAEAIVIEEKEIVENETIFTITDQTISISKEKSFESNSDYLFYEYTKIVTTKKTKQKSKSNFENENQLSLFDYLENKAV